MNRFLNAGRSILFSLYHRIPHSLETNIFMKDWDVLVLADACRVDKLATVTDEFSWLPEQVESIWSVGSTSREWMDKTFTEEVGEQLADTIYVTGNPYSSDQVNGDRFRDIFEVWKTNWDDELGTVPPRPITDRAINVAQTTEPERLVIHYMQPHFPSIPSPVTDGVEIDEFGEERMGAWQLHDEGEADAETLEQAYMDNLRYILEEIDLLRQNIDADRMILSSDHGQSFGEWGIYGHPIKKPVPVVRRVPWVDIPAENTGEHQPTIEPHEQINASVQERLRDLGYTS